MLPATGFFKNIDCPYYEVACDRPYCHFKHRKKNEESAGPGLMEIPTYNPTPKSQLANAKSHIPISYVPDLAVRKERNNFRSLSSYTHFDKQPTYNPTPLSVLSTGKAIKSNITIVTPQESNIENDLSTDYNYDINFDDLEVDLNMLSEIINEANANEIKNEANAYEINIEENPNKIQIEENTKQSEKSSLPKVKVERDCKSPTNPSKVHDKHNGTVKDSKSSRKSSTNHKKDNKVESRRSKDEKRSKKVDEKSRSDSKRKSESSSKSSKHKSSSSDKSKHRHKSKTKEREKEDKKKEKTKRHDENKEKNTQISKVPDILKNLNSSSIVENDVEDDSQNYLDDDSDLEEDPMAECYKIFTEYKPTEPEIFSDTIKESPIISDCVINKKRIAHENVDKVKQPVSFHKPKLPTVAQIMTNRLKMARLKAIARQQEDEDIVAEISRQLKRPAEVELTSSKSKIVKRVSRVIDSKPKVSESKPKVSASKPSTSTTLVDDIISGKSSTAKSRRIAPAQNVFSIQRAKAKIAELTKVKALNSINKTVSQNVKGSKRVAHVPDFSVADIPDVLMAERSKLPVNVRSRFLKMIFEESVKLYFSREEAQERALNEEYKCYERCSALVTYRNSAMLAVSRLRKELQERETSGLGPIMPGESTDSKQDSNKTVKFYENIKQFVLTDEELILHGFPREGTTPGKAIIKNPRKVVNQGHLDENERVCCRCSKHYKIDKYGLALFQEECIYHPLKKRTFRGDSIYLCCKSSEGNGCVTSTTHVSESATSNDDEFEGYQTTMPPEYEGDPRNHQVFALDCEMCYTTKGLELTRVTVVNSECKTVYESLVKPLNPIIDYNTRFSGITEEQMERTATSILQVQANILHLCNSNTILIGHSLESDMKALKIIHSSIIDTSVLFPHKFGLPHKRALRDLAREFLKKIIQNDINGHDSAEDALTCMELIQWKLKEDFKTRGIKL